MSNCSFAASFANVSSDVCTVDELLEKYLGPKQVSEKLNCGMGMPLLVEASRSQPTMRKG